MEIPSEGRGKGRPCPKCPSSNAYKLYDDGHGFCFSCKTYFHSKDNSMKAEAKVVSIPNKPTPTTGEY